MQASGRVTLCQTEQRPREEMIVEEEREREQRRAGAARRNDHWRAETNEREGCEQYPGASWRGARRRVVVVEEMVMMGWRREREREGWGGLERWLVFVVGAAATAAARGGAVGGLRACVRACFEHSASQRKAQYVR